MNWQRANIQAAAAYLRERIAAGATDPRTKAVYDGLLEVLEPARRVAREKRDLLAATQNAVPVSASRERRTQDRRRSDRRKVDVGSPTGVERRAGADRRTGRDRRGK